LNKSSQPLSKASILGVRLDTLTKLEIFEALKSFFHSTRPHHVVTLNSLMILETETHPILRDICDDASLVIPESSGVSWAASYTGVGKIERIPGIDFALEACGMAAQLEVPIYLLGGGPGVVKKAAGFLTSVYPTLQISGMRDGYFTKEDEPSIIRDISASQARLVLVALGMPKQEFWIHEHMSVLPPAVYVGVGGSFDVWSGRIKRAPAWLISLGLEWFYRLKQEPFRWKRMARLPEFALKVATRPRSQS
jgi:N-acetylglucosaminyldiphosphoundecaprenol N-acetyl-beta-D-mannosaminyltransferase